jgi:hypothetical protein
MIELTEGEFGDYEANLLFAKKLFASFRKKNVTDGINLAQAFWVNQRFSAWSVSYGGNSYTLNIFGMVIGGAVDQACVALMSGSADDMSLPKHFLTQDRLNYLITEMKLHLGWP